MINVTFCIYLPDGQTWDEALPEKPPLPIHVLEGSAPEGLEGVVRIPDTNNPSNSLEDELPALIMNLCFSVSRTLQHRGQDAYDFHSYHGEIRFLRQGNVITIDLRTIWAYTLRYTTRMSLPPPCTIVVAVS